MKIERSKVARWINNPVTKAYMESLKQLEREVADSLLGSELVDQQEIARIYHRSQGAMAFLSAYEDPASVITVLHEIVEDEVAA
jgi:hypothetical protein